MNLYRRGLNMKKLILFIITILLLFLLLSCEDKFSHSVDSLNGVWNIAQIEIRDNTGNHFFTECDVPPKYYFASYFMNLDFRGPDAVIMTFPCEDSQSIVNWVLNGEEIAFYIGGQSLYGKIVHAEPNVLIIQFELDYKPYYYFLR